MSIHRWKVMWWNTGQLKTYRIHASCELKDIFQTRCNLQMMQPPNWQDGLQFPIFILNSIKFSERLISSFNEFHNLGAWYRKEFIPWVIVLTSEICSIWKPQVWWLWSQKLKTLLITFGLLSLIYLKLSTGIKLKFSI